MLWLPHHFVGYHFWNHIWNLLPFDCFPRSTQHVSLLLCVFGWHLLRMRLVGLQQYVSMAHSSSLQTYSTIRTVCHTGIHWAIECMCPLPVTQASKKADERVAGDHPPLEAQTDHGLLLEPCAHLQGPWTVIRCFLHRHSGASGPHASWLPPNCVFRMVGTIPSIRSM